MPPTMLLSNKSNKKHRGKIRSNTSTTSASASASLSTSNSISNSASASSYIAPSSRGLHPQNSQSALLSEKSFDSTPFTLASFDENMERSQWDWDTLKETSPFKHNHHQQQQQHHQQQIHPPIEMTSPSSLRSFDYPRKTKKMIQTNGHGNINPNRNNNSNNNNNSNRNIHPNVNINVLSNSTNTNTSSSAFPRRNIADINELPNPSKMNDQIPFRNRFASAALISQRLKSDDEPSGIFRGGGSGTGTGGGVGSCVDVNTSMHGNRNVGVGHGVVTGAGGGVGTSIPDPQIPTQLFLNHTHRGHGRGAPLQKSPLKELNPHEWPMDDNMNMNTYTNGNGSGNNNGTINVSGNRITSQSQISHLHHEWPISPNDDSYESFGNQSVFSDITDGMSMKSMNSPSREMRRRARNMNMNASANVQLQAQLQAQSHENVSNSIFRKKEEVLMGVQEEDDNDDNMIHNKYNYHRNQNYAHHKSVNRTAETQQSALSHSSGSDEGGVGTGTDKGENDERGLNESNGNSSAIGSGVQKERKQSRLALLFTSRALNPNSDEKKRSKSVPKPRHERNVNMNTKANMSVDVDNHPENRLVASPGRSNASGSSIGYVGWPGTMGKDGTIIAMTSSFSDDGAKLITEIPPDLTPIKVARAEQFPLVEEEVGEKSYQTPVKVEVEKKSKKGLGRKLFDRSNKKQSDKKQRNKNDKDTKSGPGRSRVLKPMHHDVKKLPKKNMGQNMNVIDTTSSGDGLSRNKEPKRENDKKIGMKNGDANTDSNVKRSRVLELKRQFEGDVVDLDEVPDSDSKDKEVEKKETQNPADIYLAKVVSRAKSASPSPCSSPANVPQHDLNMIYPVARNSSHGSLDDMVNPQKTRSIRQREKMRSRMDTHTIHEDNNESKFRPIGETSSQDNDDSSGSGSFIDVSASLRRVRSALSPESLGSIPEGEDTFRLSEEALRMNERLSPIRSNASGANVAGFRGFMDKTKDVPNLMDDESDSCTSASTMATERKLIKRTEIGGWRAPDSDSDVFDGVGSISGHSYIHHGKQKSQSTPMSEKSGKRSLPERNVVFPKTDGENVNIIKVNTSLATIQTSMDDFNNRTTSAEYDANLTESDTDFFSSDDRILSKIRPNALPSWPEGKMQPPRNASYPRSDSDSDLSDSSSSIYSTSSEQSGPFDLSKYAIDPKKVRKMVKHYRNMSNELGRRSIDPSMTEDSKKAFALFEMRSRIMETDIERGLNRTGGTKTVDDIVLTPYFQASHRVRDAVVVSKAWREGANPSDARTAYFLTTGKAGSYYIKRRRRSISGESSVISSDFSRFDTNNNDWNASYPQQPVWEKVLWMDDTDFSLLRCPSLDAAGTLRGFDIFTVGDCQSILLRLTNDYCEELQARLSEASSRQLIAEHLMKEEAEATDGTMTEAEDAYLEAMEEVTTISKKLNHAENAFEMVRGKIEELVSKYENILDRIGKSQHTDSDSNCGDDDLSDVSSLDQEAKEKLKRRTQRAELKAEVAAREAQIAKMEAEESKKEMERIRLQKEKELTTLQNRLDELEAKSALMESSFEDKIQTHKNLMKDTFKNQVGFSKDMSSESFNNNPGAHSSLIYAASTVGIDQDKNDAKERIKARFRQRRSEDGKVVNSADKSQHADAGPSSSKQNNLSGSVQQRLNFYERSLQAVERK